MSDDPRTKVRWFGVKLWFAWKVAGNSEPAVVEESIVAVRALSRDEAADIARRSVARRDTKFQNSDQRTVEIEFLCLEHVFDTIEDRMHSGIEIFSRLYDFDDVGNPELWPPPAWEET